MEFFTGFQWALPMAFADSVAQARFVEGDVLYDHAAAYNSDWRTAICTMEHTIQVRSPARSSEVNNQSVREVFARNWWSEVRIELYSHMNMVGAGQVKTTQGRLYTTLWKGQIDILFEDKSLHPLLPTTSQALSKNLEKTSQISQCLPQGHTTFIMVRDISNSISRSKYQKVQAKLHSHMSQDPIILTPKEARCFNTENIAPTVDIALFPTIGIEASQLEDLVKQAVYVPGKDAKRDMFRLSAHGIIV